MKQPLNVLLAVAFLLPLSAGAQADKKEKSVQESLRDRAIKRCRENRGTDCDTDRGLREWLREDTPLTEEERVSAAAARRHRELCAKNSKGTGC